MYIFKFPAAADFALTYANLHAYIVKGRDGHRRKIGTTVEVILGTTSKDEELVMVELYGTRIVDVYQDGRVSVSARINHYGSQATGNWVSKVLHDNGFYVGVWRTKGCYEGVAGRTFEPDNDDQTQAAVEAHDRMLADIAND